MKIFFLLEFNCELTENRLRTEDLISNTKYKELVKNNMNKIYVSFGKSLFSPKHIIDLLKVVPNTATNYIKKLSNLDLLDKVSLTSAISLQIIFQLFIKNLCC